MNKEEKLKADLEFYDQCKQSRISDVSGLAAKGAAVELELDTMSMKEKVMRIIGFGIPPELCELKADEIIRLFAKHKLESWNKEQLEKYSTLAKCWKCGIVPAKSGGCINHSDCPMIK